MIHGTLKYLQSEGTHTVYRSPAPVFAQDHPQESYCVPEVVVQMLIDLCQAVAVTISLVIPVPKHSLGEKSSPNI